jgi:hypothetical protein
MKRYLIAVLALLLLGGCASGSPAGGGNPWAFQTGNTVVVTWKRPPGADTLRRDWADCVKESNETYVPQIAGNGAKAGLVKTCMEKRGYVKLDEKWWSDHGLTVFNSYEVPDRATQPDQTQAHFHQ